MRVGNSNVLFGCSVKKGANTLHRRSVGDVQETRKAQKEISGQKEITLTCLSRFTSRLTRSLLLFLSLLSLILSALLLCSTYVALPTFYVG